MDYPKVLVATPQHESKNYCWEQWSERVKNLTYPNYEVYISDNSDTKDNMRFIKKDGFSAGYVKDKGEGLVPRINESHNACRNYALQNDFEYMLHLESDVIPPIDVIERLMANRVRICSAVYDIFHGKERRAMIQMPEEVDRAVKSFLTIDYLGGKEPLFFDGSLKRVYHAGIGCILIKRDILQKIPFRVDSSVDLHSDTWFATDCFERNVAIYADPTVTCEHLNSTWLDKTDKFFTKEDKNK